MLSGVDVGRNWFALVWGLNFGLKFWSECWFDWSASRPKPCFAGLFGCLKLIRIQSVFGSRLV